MHILKFWLLFLRSIVLYNTNTLLKLILDLFCVRLDLKLANKLNQNTFEKLNCINLETQAKSFISIP